MTAFFDPSLIVTPLLDIALAAFTAAVPIVVPAILKRLRIANASAYADTITKAADAGAGVAYKYAVEHEGGLTHVGVHDAALAEGVTHVLTTVPDALHNLGITPDNVHALVSARLGVLLASDPTVSAGSPTVSPPVEATPKP